MKKTQLKSNHPSTKTAAISLIKAADVHPAGAKFRLRGYCYSLGLLIASIFIIGPLSACDRQDLPAKLWASTAYERYAAELQQQSFSQTPVVEDWLNAMPAAKQQPLRIALPYQEAGWFIAEQPTAVAFEFELQAGQKLHISLNSETSNAEIFAELYQLEKSGWKHLEAVELGINYQQQLNAPRRFQLLLQGPLLQNLQYQLLIHAQGSLAFPIQDFGNRAVQSWFGDPRDGGKRRHEGVDIFAPRGTPVLAIADGKISSTRDNKRGGKVIWLQSKSQRLQAYYAHLDQVGVATGQRVKRGEVIGQVGNTGNARHTPPHLHFGLYRNGAIDPLPYITHSVIDENYQQQLATKLMAHGRALQRVTSSQANLRSQPNTRQKPLASLERNTAVQVLGASKANWRRIRLPDQRQGFISARLIAGISPPIRKLQNLRDITLFQEPHAQAQHLAKLEHINKLDVLAELDDYLLVTLQQTDGRQLKAWITQQE